MNLYETMGGSRYNRKKLFFKLVLNLMLLLLVILLIFDNIFYEQLSNFINFFTE